MGPAHDSVSNSRATRLQDIQTRSQARTKARKDVQDALRATIQASREARSRASSARSQASTRAAPEKASIPQARSQAYRQQARSQASPPAATVKASSHGPLKDSKATARAALRSCAMVKARGSGVALASAASKPKTVATAHRPEHKPANSKALPVRPAKLPSGPDKPLRISPAPRYVEPGKTPVHPDSARPSRRPVAPPKPASPPQADQPFDWLEYVEELCLKGTASDAKADQSFDWFDFAEEMSAESTGSVAKEAASNCPQGKKVPGSSDRSRSLRLLDSTGSVGRHEPAHRSAAPTRSALSNGSSRMAKRLTVRFDDSDWRGGVTVRSR